MSIAALAVRRPVSTVAAVLAVVLLGSVSLARLPVSLLPDVSLPVLVIRTLYPGAAAEEVSRFVAEPVEEAIAATPGLVELRSESRSGEATTTARFAWGMDMREAVLTLRERLDAARARLPERAERPTLLTSDPGERPIAVLALRGELSDSGGAARAGEWRERTGNGAYGQRAIDLRTLARTASDLHARRLEQIDGVASVAVVGAPNDEIRVDLDPERLRALDLSPEDVAQDIRNANPIAESGTIRRGQFRLSVRTLTEFRTPAEILDTPLARTGSHVTLRDVGKVQLGLADPRTIATLDGVPAIGLVVYKDAGANTVAVTSRLTEAIGQLQKELPGIRISVVSAQADFVVDALGNLWQEILAGGVLSLLVILLFLRDWRVSLAITAVVPLSVLMALFALQSLHVSINVLSLGGLALGTGLLVDTAIVVAESIGRRRDEGMSLRDAAVLGTDDVSAPLFAGTLTTLLVFGPIVFVRGLAAALFRDLSLSVVTTVAASLLLALTLMPVMIVGRRRGAEGLPRDEIGARAGGNPRENADALGNALVHSYERGVAWSLAHTPWVFTAAVVLMLSTGLLVRVLPKEILPRVDEGELVAELHLAEGTSIAATVAQVGRVERAARALGAHGVYARIGRATDAEILAGAAPGSSATAHLIVPVPEGDDAASFAQRLRARVPDLAGGALSFDLSGQSEFGALIGRQGRLVRVELSSRSAAESERWADSVRRALRGLTQLADVRDAYASTQPLVEIGLRRERLAERGILPQQVASVLAGALGGVNASELRETDRRTPITVRYAGARNEELETALLTPIRGVPVGQLVTVRETRAPLEIVREGQRPVTIVEALVEQGGTERATRAVTALMASLALPPGVTWVVGGADAERKRTSDELALVLVLAAVLMFLVLAGEFASFTIPLVVMLTVPLAGAGAVILLWITGQSLNAVSLIGIVVMIGMADNEAVVKLDAIRRFRESGCGIDEAILLGGRQRLRAIAMTSITTITGVLPLLFGWGSGGALYRPLAAAIIGGSVSALLVTIFLLPAAYATLERQAEVRAQRGAARALAAGE